MPRPRSLTPEKIAAAALAVIDRDELPALTMRAVARQLQMGTMSLYRYVADREELEGLVVEHLLDTVDTEVPADAPWRERLALLVGRVRDTVRAHPNAVPLLLVYRHVASCTLRWGEAVLGTLADAGLGGEQRVVAFRCLLSFLIGRLQTELLSPLSGRNTEAVAALSEADYPWLVDTARHARDIPTDTEFRRGLAIVLDGIATLRAEAENGGAADGDG